MTRALRILLPAATLGLALLLPSTSHAFERTTTCIALCDDLCDFANNGICQDGGDGATSTDDPDCAFGTDCADCGYRPAEGTSPYHCADGEVPLPIAWTSSCLTYRVNEAGSADLPGLEALVDTVRLSFDTWNAVSCANIRATYAGLTNENRPGYSTCTDNTNFVSFVEAGWNSIPGYPARALAVTSVTFNPRNGNIADADIELNSANFTFGRVEGDPSPGIQDLQNTLTHEIGHFFGLDHSEPATHVGEGTYDEATMALSSVAGATDKRDLLDDDIAGLCAIYPLELGQARPECTATESYFEAPAIGPDDECPDTPTTTVKRRMRGCASGSGGGGPVALGLALVAIASLRRRR